MNHRLSLERKTAHAGSCHATHMRVCLTVCACATALAACAPSEVTQAVQNVQVRPPAPVERRPPGPDRRRDPGPFIRDERPGLAIRQRGVQPLNEASSCTTVLSLVNSLQETLRHRWLVVRGTVASTPSVTTANVMHGGSYGVGERIERSRFELRVRESSDVARVPVGTVIWIAHQSAIFSRTMDDTFELERRDLLDGRPRRAPIAAERDVLLVLSNDVFDQHGKLLIASIALSGEQLAESALALQPGASVAALFTNCQTTQALIDAEATR